MSNRGFFDTQITPAYPSAQREEPTIGADEEQIQRAAIGQIFANLADAVAYEEALWAARDLTFAEKMGRKYEQVQIAVPKPDSFYTGPRPSLVESPVEFWPSITARCNSSKAAPEGLDNMDVVATDLFIEILCVSGAVQKQNLHTLEGIRAEGFVDSQVQRLTAAVQGCVAMDKSLGANNQLIDRAPSVKPSVPFARPGSGPGGNGDYYIFQGKQLGYTVIKHAI